MSKQLPAAALEQHIAILGKTRSGKTSTAKGVIEGIARDKGRVCILDPIKSDWWGLTLAADGKRAGLPFDIVGGPFGHVPLHAGAGKALGRIVADGSLKLSIIDMADFGPGEHAAFLVDFAQSLFRNMAGVLYLVVEEAHIFAPKDRTGEGKETMGIHWMKRLASGAGSKGVRLIVCTQRPAELNNTVLASCETIIAHRTTFPEDQERIVKWFRSHTNKETAATVAATLSGLAKGEAYLSIGEAGIFERRQFPMFTTYDNTATPTGNASAVVTPPPVDQDKLRSLIGDAVKEAEANDPKLLRKKIAELQAQAKGKAAPVADPKAVERAVAQAEAIRDKHWQAQMRQMEKAVGVYTGRLGQIAKLAHLNGEAPKLPAITAPAPRMITHSAPVRTPPRKPVQIDGDWSSPQQQLLEAFAWFKAIGVENPNHQQLCFRCGWSPTSSHISNVIGSLRTAGAVQGNRLVMEVDAPDLGTIGEYHDQIRKFLDQPRRQLFDHLLETHPDESSKDTACAALGWSPDSSHISNVVGSLRSYGLVEPRSFRLSEIVFPASLPA